MSCAFFESVIGAGAILSGFCGTFLAFRIQREASYYRQPVLDFESKTAKDVEIGLTHFTSPLLLLLLSTAAALIFGFVVPLLAIAGIRGGLIRPAFVVAGLVAAVLLLIGYFAAELVHYKVFSSKLVNDVAEWREGRWLLFLTLFIATAAALAAFVMVG